MVQTIRFGDEGQVASREILSRFNKLAEGEPSLRGGDLERYLRTLEALDRQYGGSGRLPLEDAGELLAATLGELAHLEQAARRGGDPVAVADLTLGVALWALRHELAIAPVEPVANALAARANAARTKQELAAVFGLMQGVIESVRPALHADLERSNPERPWRILHVNFAIAAIRTEDEALMGFAFDALDAALPGEAAGFYAEALALALAPGIAPNVRQQIELRHRRSNLS
jgi:hypothetical protein